MKTLQNGTKISDQCFSYLNVHLNIMHTVSKGLTMRMVVLNRISFFELNNTAWHIIWMQDSLPMKQLIPADFCMTCLLYTSDAADE